MGQKIIAMDTLEKFGKFIVAALRDKSIEQHDMLAQGKLKAAKIQDLQTQLSSLPEDQKQLVRRILVDALDTAMHDLLFAIQDAHDRDLGINVIVDGEDVAEKSGMLHGEPIGEGGWIDKYSRFG